MDKQSLEEKILMLEKQVKKIEKKIERNKSRIDHIEYGDDGVFDNSHQKLFYEKFSSQFITNTPFGKKYLEDVLNAAQHGTGKLIYRAGDIERLKQMIHTYSKENEYPYETHVEEDGDEYRFIIEK